MLPFNSNAALSLAIEIRLTGTIIAINKKKRNDQPKDKKIKMDDKPRWVEQICEHPNPAGHHVSLSQQLVYYFDLWP